MNNNRKRRNLPSENETPSKKQRVALYLDDYRPVRTIEVNNVEDDVTSAYLKGYFEHAAGRVCNVWIVNKPIRRAFVTFVMPEDAAKLICEPNLLSDSKFTIKEAEKMFQPMLDPNSLQFEEIIDDCLLKIASYLELSDIINLGKSSQRLQSVTQLIYRTKTHFAFGTDTGDSSINELNVEAALQEMGKYIQSVEWHGLHQHHLQFLLANCPNVTELKLINPSHVLHLDVIKRNMRFFTNLETLKLYRSSVFDGPLKQITSNSSITSLVLEDCHNIAGKFLSKWRNSRLQFLKINNFRWMNKLNRSELFNFVSRNQLVTFSCNYNFLPEYTMLPPHCLFYIEELELNFTGASDAQLEHIDFGHLQRLTHFSVTMTNGNGGSRNCNTLLTALNGIRTLKSLTIRRFRTNDDTLNCLGSLTNLRELRFHESVIQNEFYESLHRHLPMLEVFHYDNYNYYSGNASATNKSICKLISSLTALKMISCSYMSYEFLTEILQVQLGLKRPKIEIAIVHYRLEYDKQWMDLAAAYPEAVKLTKLPQY